MTIYTLMSTMVALAALFGYLNSRYLKIPTTIAIMSGSLLISLLLIIFGKLGFGQFEQQVAMHLNKIDFHTLLMQGMLSFLLFAGALTIDVNHLRSCKWEIATLALLSTIASTFLVGFSIYALITLTHFQIPLIYCLLFGALISPTDPIAVLAIFKQAGAPSELEVTVTGESLFNDGVAIVMFLTLYHVAFSGEHATIGGVTRLFLQQAVGGITYGLLLGMLAYKLIKTIDDYKVEILITLAVATGGYALANALHLSGPLAMVAAGIFIGNKGRQFGMKKSTRDNLDNFWELVDEVLNAVLFLLIGLELLVIDHSHQHFLLGIAAIPLVLSIRYITVFIPITYFKRKKTYPPNFINILVWGGLRGGLAVALALTLPPSEYRNLILTLTYPIVVFSIIIQGLTIKSLVQSTSS